MTDVFIIAFTDETREAARRVAAALKARGLEARFDLPGPRSEVVEALLDRARLAVVMWSRDAAEAPLVAEAARRALARNVYVGARVERGARPPKWCEAFGVADLTRLRLDAGPLEAFVEALRQRLEALTVKTSASASAAPIAVGAAFRDRLATRGAGPEMVALPGGRFRMGSETVEAGRCPDEGPPREVTVAPFALGRCAVAFRDYDAYCAATGADRPYDKGWGRGWRPVINVSCVAAQAYCDWLSAETGARYRLPSEAEWEYACRAGGESAFWWGDEITAGQANFNGGFRHPGGGAYGAYRGETVEVDAFAPNPFGLHQMHGNVREWCADCWSPTYAGAPADGAAWIRGDCARAVLRGGSWASAPWFARSAARFGCSRVIRNDTIGFRVARDIG